MPHTNNALKILTGHKSKIDTTLAKPFEDIRVIEKPIVINGINKKIITPLIRCIIDTIAGIGNRMVNRFMFLGCLFIALNQAAS